MKYNYDFSELVRNDKRFSGKVELDSKIILDILINSIETRDWDMIEELIKVMKDERQG